ncbi:c-type cytochrome [Aquabacterium sp.]|uniref:c-type cytochrome n=1 Tax=Aquabacterium sp. TaxID=1872578 RepID=UPI003D6C835D
MRPPLFAALILAMGIAGPLKAAPRVENSIAQRVQACTVCHGPQGRAAADGYYPRIAGKPAGYLYNQLRNFRDGRRHYALMANLLDPLSDAYLREIAQYFAALDLPYPAQRPSSTATAAEIQHGQTLATQGDARRKIPACVQCHGASLTGVQPAIPGLLGVPRDYINAQLGSWKNGNRQAKAPDCMASIAQRLEPEDIAALAQWISAQPVPEHAKAGASLPGPLPMPCGGVNGPEATP